MLALLHVVDFQRTKESLALGFLLRRGLHRLSSSCSFTSLTPFHPTAFIFPLVFHCCNIAVRSDRYRKSHPCVLWLRPLSSADAILRCDLIAITYRIHVCFKVLPLTSTDVILRCNLIAITNRPMCVMPPPFVFRRCDIAISLPPSDLFTHDLTTRVCLLSFPPDIFFRCDLRCSSMDPKTIIYSLLVHTSAILSLCL